ncbi:MAG TPA: lytic transglycosylase domain-containing protein, partial [Longimicrobiales bacterium]
PGRGPSRPGRASAELEEEITRRLSREEQAREDTINRAIARYGISRKLAEDIYDAARAEKIDPRLAYGLVNTESAFKTRAVSSVGARGLTQVMPRTARWLVPGTTAEDLFDPHTNLRIGFRYLRYLLDKYGGNRRLALLAYNRGPGIVDRILARGGDPDNGYADKVLRGRV